ncbi:MAG: sigma 54-interacting transcriptional regulator [Ignavibacteriaceae bacterium]
MDEELSQFIFNSISDGIFTTDKNCRITSFNKAAEKITGFSASEAINKNCFDVFRTDICNKRCALKDTLKNEEPIENIRVTIISRNGCEIPINVTTTLLKDKNNKVIGAVELFRDISELEHLRECIKSNRTLDEIVSMNSQMQQIISLLPNIAESDCNVLIQGPSGAGKELFAQVIHNLSPRKYGPYIKINCAALPAQLLESELFGYEKGAFTDAKHDKPGQFCLANGGTLLLDEISEMDISLQVKLLRVLNNGEYRPLGSSKTLYSDARIIAATNADLKREIEKNKFREDLYYRINVMNIKIPPLKERSEDIPLLVNHFLRMFKKKNRNAVEKISPEALGILMKYSFPGNVRELENAIQHTFVMCRDGEILPEHLPESITDEHFISKNVKGESKDERELIIESLKRNKGNKSKAAVELGMHRSTLWRKIKELRVNI